MAVSGEVIPFINIDATFFVSNNLHTQLEIVDIYIKKGAFNIIIYSYCSYFIPLLYFTLPEEETSSLTFPVSFDTN